MKSDSQVINQIKELKWEKWLKRPFFAFSLSLSEDCFDKESTKYLGMENITLEAMLFQGGIWYYCQKVFDQTDNEIEKYLDQHGMIGITNNLAKFKDESEKKIKSLLADDLSVDEKYIIVHRILSTAMAFIWLTHGIESYYNKKLAIEVPKYIKNDIDKFIGDASFPKKKNLNSVLDSALRSDMSAEEVVALAGWTKVRDGFSEPYTVSEIHKLRSEIGQIVEQERPIIPEPLISLFEQIQELVFFRTERTDVFYYLYYLARPIIKEMGEKRGINFSDLKYYRAKSFILGQPEKYGEQVSFGYFKGESIFQDGPIIKDDEIDLHSVLKGTVAFRGLIKGQVKIVRDINELDKVRPGDIMVTQMTFPSFIPAMNRAAAFVTDEGGITCHAAIVAREMKKPCIIGTKRATQILKDGDIVEVDAVSGIIKIIKENV